MEIQLVIRAPNQNFEDQVIDCSDDWTVLKLKEHLSEVYPNKPIVKDQKLIYSGHLLQDNLRLKDVVRAAEDEPNVHIFHLVYNCKDPVLPAQAPKSDQNSVQHSPLTHSSGFVYPTANIVSPVSHSSLQGVNNHSMMSFPALYNDPNMFSQMVAMQQMYAQYMIQYWQNAYAAMNNSTANTPVLPNQAMLQNGNNAVAYVPPQQQPAERPNAGDDDEANFDWFEFALQHCRFLVLVGIMYFYSSPEKFFIVISFLVFTALYREGWLFRETIEEFFNRLQNWINQDAVNAAGNDDNRAQPINEEAQNGQELEAAMDGDNPPHVQNPDIANNNQQNSFLSIIAAFFFSLVPEAPPPVNIN